MSVLDKVRLTIRNTHERLDAIVQGIDNQSKLLDSRLAALVQGIEAITELQKAQLVMQREQAEALDRVAASIADLAGASKDLIKRGSQSA
jgi:hypothetical protein